MQIWLFDGKILILHPDMLRRFYKYCFMALILMASSCGEYNNVFKSSDIDFKYETAKAMYVDGHYSKAAELFGTLLVAMKGTPYGEECMYMLALSNFMAKDYDSASSFFKKYYQSYPKGMYVEQARFYSGYALYRQVPDVRLDQSGTMDAIVEFNNFIDYYPNSSLRSQTQQMIFDLQDKLVEKEYLSAKMYYDLGAYTMNCAYGGNNYEACVVTAQNAIKDYPYANPLRKEELSILILRAKYNLARQSVEEKRIERYRETIDEYYAFVSDFPESKYMKEANSIFSSAESIVKKKNWIITSDND